MGARRRGGETALGVVGEVEALLGENVEVDGELRRGLGERPGGEDRGGAYTGEVGRAAGGGGCDGGRGSESGLGGWGVVARGGCGLEVRGWWWVSVAARGSLREGMWEGEGGVGMVVDGVWIREGWKAGVGAGLCAFAVVDGRRAGHLGDEACERGINCELMLLARCLK